MEQHERPSANTVQLFGMSNSGVRILTFDSTFQKPKVLNNQSGTEGLFLSPFGFYNRHPGTMFCNYL